MHLQSSSLSLAVSYSQCLVSTLNLSSAVLLGDVDGFVREGKEW